MSLIVKVLLKVREGRGRKPLFKRHRNESFVGYMNRMIKKETDLGKSLTGALTHNRINKNTFPLFYFTKQSYKAKHEFETECWMKDYKKHELRRTLKLT
jgi:hypothetical protein